LYRLAIETDSDIAAIENLDKVVLKSRSGITSSAVHLANHKVRRDEWGVWQCGRTIAKNARAENIRD
jgi:hypothetical protein